MNAIKEMEQTILSMNHFPISYHIREFLLSKKNNKIRDEAKAFKTSQLKNVWCY